MTNPDRNKRLSLADSTPVTRLIRLFFIVFTVVFAGIWLGAVVDLDGYRVIGEPLESPWLCAAVCAIYLAVWAVLLLLFSRRENESPAPKKCAVLTVTIAAFFAMAAYALIYPDAGLYEVYFTFDAASAMANGNSLHHYASNGLPENYYVIYYMQFQNIRNFLLYLFTLFRAERLCGVTDFRTVSALYFCLKTALSIPMLHYVAERKFGRRAGLYAVLFFLLCLPILTKAPVIYHTTGTFSYALMLLFFFVLLQNTSKRIIRCCCIVGSVIIAALGTFLTTIPVIMLIAIVIEALLLSPRRVKWTYLAVSVATILVAVSVNSLSAAYQHKRFYDPDVAETVGYPTETWLYVGLNPDTYGVFDIRDKNYYDSVKTVAERKALLRDGIRARLSAMGPIGLIRHLYLKSVVEFGTGSLSTNQTQDNRLFTGSESSRMFYRILCQGVHLGLLFLVVLGAFSQLSPLEWGGVRPTFPAPFIAVFGLFLATLFNETSPRHIYSFLPVFFLCASAGAKYAETLFRRLRMKAAAKKAA